MEIKVYDMLVFEDKDGNIYQDCVICLATEKDSRIGLNGYTFEMNEYYDVTSFYVEDGDYGRFINNIKLKEIWTRTDETTYKKVWDKDDAWLKYNYELNHLDLGTSYEIDPDTVKAVKTLHLHEIADKLLEDECIDGVSYYLTDEECLEILNYIKEKTFKIYKITRNENDYSDKMTYDYYLAESDIIEVESEYWPCYAR